MKKLILTALAVAGLMGSSAQGAAAMAAGLGAKAYGFLQAAALPALGAQIAYDLHGYLHPSVKQDLAPLHDQMGELKQMHGQMGELKQEINGLNSAIKYIPQVAKGLEAAGIIAAPATWYGKTWRGLCYVDSAVDCVVGPIQKYMFVLSLVGSGIGYLLNKAQPQPQPQESGEDAFIEKIAAKVAAAMPAATSPVMYMPRRRAARRSGMVARA
jgi:hypothetical protein